MKKLLALLIIFGAVLSVSVSSATAEEFNVTDYLNPFTGNAYTEDSFDGSGKIGIILTHADSIVWFERTVEDFAEIELESVNTTSPSQKDQELREENPNYREVIYVTMKDKSNRSLIEAVQALYDSGKYYHAEPKMRIRPLGDVTGDYRRNLSDAVVMLKAIAGWDDLGYELSEDDLRLGDFYGMDGVDLSDVAVLLRILAGWEEYVWMYR